MSTTRVYVHEARRYAGATHRSEPGAVAFDPLPAAEVMHADTDARSGLVTLSICPEDHERDIDDDIGYELDLTPFSARQLARQLLDEADEAELVSA
jgi:hypothetical protein